MLNKVIDYFGLDTSKVEHWQPVTCVYQDHPDNHQSAGILLTEEAIDQNDLTLAMYNCLGCNRKHNLMDLLPALKIDTDDDSWLNLDDLEIGSYEEEEEEKQPKPKRTKKLSMSKILDYVNDFIAERGYTEETLTTFGFEYHKDPKSDRYGYVSFDFSGMKVYRKVIPDVEGERYLNPKGSNRTLIKTPNFEAYNSVILVEGVTDLLSMYESGFRNVVASLGAALSRPQAYELRNRVVFILYDKDFAGYDGARKAHKLLKEYGATPVILEIPDHCFLWDNKTKGDPSSCIQFNEDLFTAWLKESTSKYNTFNTHFVDTLFQDSNNLKIWETGWQDFDFAMSGGLVRGTHAITGLPASGKSTLCIDLVDNFLKQGARVLLLTYELSVEQYWARLASRYSEHSWTEIERNPHIVGKKVKNLMMEYAKSLRIDSDLTLEEIQISSQNFDIIVVDYIQRMPSDLPDERSGIKRNAKGLSDLTRSQEKVVILLSSMPRSQYNLETAGAFKETGDIEYIIQSGMIIKKDEDTISCRMIKNTRGILSTFWLSLDWQHQRVSSYELDCTDDAFQSKNEDTNPVSFEIETLF